jgi:hypothetical protein
MFFKTFNILSGRPGSNRPPSAWKADALPNELLPLLFPFSSPDFQSIEVLKAYCGAGWIRTTEDESTDLQSVPFGHSGTAPNIFSK